MNGWAERASRFSHGSGPTKSAYDCLFGLPGPAAAGDQTSQAHASEERARQSSTQESAERAPEWQSTHRHSAGHEQARLSSQLVAYTSAFDCEGASRPAPAWKWQRGSPDPKAPVQQAKLSLLQRIQACDPQEGQPITSFGGSFGERSAQSLACMHAREGQAFVPPDPRHAGALDERASSSRVATSNGEVHMMGWHVPPGPGQGGSALGRPTLGSAPAPGSSRGCMPAANLPTPATGGASKGGGKDCMQRQRAAGGGKAAFVPWRSYSRMGPGGTVQKPPPSGGGVQTLLLNGVWEKPPGYVPRVHKVTDVAELDKRALEATRLGPALSEASWEKMLGEPAAALAAWNPDALRREQLDAICALAGHSRLAAVRRHLHAFNQFLCETYGSPHLECMRTAVGMARLKAYCRHRDEKSAEAKKKAAGSRKRKREEGRSARGTTRRTRRVRRSMS